eukprot:scaffold152016_cov18-Tisochrysis_lutea.AAC.1
MHKEQEVHNRGKNKEEPMPVTVPTGCPLSLPRLMPYEWRLNQPSGCSFDTGRDSRCMTHAA